MQEMWVQSLGWEDPLEKEMATHSSILAWEILWTMGSHRVGQDLVTKAALAHGGCEVTKAARARGRCEVVSHCDSICISTMTDGAVCLFMYLIGQVCFSPEGLLKSFAQF